jgi:carboxyl-terminal processing protease
VEKVIQEHISQKKELSGIILDLRRNPGGLLDQAIKVSDLFLEDGLTIVSTQGRKKETKEVTTATKRPKYTGFPMLVLIDAGSASASEIVAGALQDHKRALIMGSRSFGKGSVQSIMKLGDGSALKLTIARYYTPSGRSIQAEGILPDLIFENSSDSPSTTAVLKDGTSKVRKIRERDIENHLNNDKKITPEKPDTWTDSDLTLAQAVNYIKAMSYGARNQKGAEQIAK